VLKRILDIIVALAGLAAGWPVLLALALAVRLDSAGPAIHWSRRVGRGNRLFFMPKFRSMRTDTPDVATHLLEDPQRWVTRIGRVLRRTSLDELPQLWSVLVGDMSLVGPRPALFNQDDLIALRTLAGVDRLRPGVTGWAQVNGRDDLPIPEKVRLDAEYLARGSLAFDLKIVAATLRAALSGRGVSH
jgi:O-antigen biosynthesis protein WbqP